MAVQPCGFGAGGGAHMGKEQVRVDLFGEGAQVRVVPGGQHFAEHAGLGLEAVPADAETVAIGARLALEALETLLDQRVVRLEDQVLEKDRVAPIGNPAAHLLSPQTSQMRPMRPESIERKR